MFEWTMIAEELPLDVDMSDSRTEDVVASPSVDEDRPTHGPAIRIRESYQCSGWSGLITPLDDPIREESP